MTLFNSNRSLFLNIRHIDAYPKALVLPALLLKLRLAPRPPPQDLLPRGWEDSKFLTFRCLFDIKFVCDISGQTSNLYRLSRQANHSFVHMFVRPKVCLWGNCTRPSVYCLSIIVDYLKPRFIRNFTKIHLKITRIFMFFEYENKEQNKRTKNRTE